MGALFAVAIATRSRPEHLARTLDALDAQSDRDFDVVVVDQSDPPDPELARREEASERLRVIRDTGRGTSRARNLAWRALDRRDRYTSVTSDVGLSVPHTKFGEVIIFAAITSAVRPKISISPV